MELEGHFRRELLEYCQRFERAIQPVIYYLDESVRPGFDRSSHDGDAFWRDLEDAVNIAANISKLLWPPRKDRAALRSELRESLGIEDDNALKLRTVRDSIEHYDERVEDAITNGPNGATFITRFIGPRDMIGEGNFIIARWYDNSTHRLHIFDDSLSLRELVAGVRDLHERLLRQARERPYHPYIF